MDGKLDQSLDEILTSRKKNVRARRPANKAKDAKKVTMAPIGGVSKRTRVTRSNSFSKGTSGGLSAPAKGSKIIVTGLPYDVTENQIQDYFGKSVGQIKKVYMTYNQQGRSTGVATIMFTKADAALTAAKNLNGMLVDKRPMKIEVIVDAKSAPAPTKPKSLGDRVTYAKPAKPHRMPKGQGLTKASSNAKAKPKSAVTDKGAVKGVKGAKGAKTDNKKAKGDQAKKGKNARPQRKTAEQLDADMADYWDGGAAPAAGADTNANGNVQQAATGGDDLGMDGIS